MSQPTAPPDADPGVSHPKANRVIALALVPEPTIESVRLTNGIATVTYDQRRGQLRPALLSGRPGAVRAATSSRLTLQRSLLRCHVPIEIQVVPQRWFLYAMHRFNGHVVLVGGRRDAKAQKQLLIAVRQSPTV